MPEDFWDDNWTAIAGQRASVKRITWMKRMAAAAVLVISAGLLYNGIQVKKPSAPIAANEKPALKTERKITVNNSERMMDISLPDSSQVILSPGSLITYNIPFAENKREVTLDGEARFRVMKNEQKPFTVFAGGLATTALGTEFTINTKNNVSVKLHNGRVMITATGEIMKHWKKNIILEPGQQLNYNTKEMTAAVNLIKAENPVAHSSAVKKPKKLPAEAPGLNFVNASLPDVMNRLTTHYQEKINFDSTELSEMNFTGAISENDSLPIVLKVIAQMNDLQLSHDENGYQLKKTDK
jgi:ferric-dicitrate binding protein FerR (iron transport regulator)